MVSVDAIAACANYSSSIQKKAGAIVKKFTAPSLDQNKLAAMTADQANKMARMRDAQAKECQHSTASLKQEFAALKEKIDDAGSSFRDPASRVALDTAQRGAVEAILQCESAGESQAQQARALSDAAVRKARAEMSAGKQGAASPAAKPRSLPKKSKSGGGGGLDIGKIMAGVPIKAIAGAAAAVAAAVLVVPKVGSAVGSLKKKGAKKSKGKGAVGGSASRQPLGYVEEMYYEERMTPSDFIKECADALAQGIEKLGCSLPQWQKK